MTAQRERAERADAPADRRWRKSRARAASAHRGQGIHSQASPERDNPYAAAVRTHPRISLPVGSSVLPVAVPAPFQRRFSTARHGRSGTRPSAGRQIATGQAGRISGEGQAESGPQCGDAARDGAGGRRHFGWQRARHGPGVRMRERGGGVRQRRRRSPERKGRGASAARASREPARGHRYRSSRGPRRAGRGSGGGHSRQPERALRRLLPLDEQLPGRGQLRFRHQRSHA